MTRKSFKDFSNVFMIVQVIKLKVLQLLMPLNTLNESDIMKIFVISPLQLFVSCSRAYNIVLFGFNLYDIKHNYAS